jgi:putative ABC transport system permease protein
VRAWLTFRIALRALVRNKLRTVLTMLGIVIGVGAVIAMLSIGNGAKLAVEERIAGMGTNSVHVWPGFRRGRNRGAAGSSLKLTVADWKAVAALPEVMNSCPMATSSAQLVAGSANWSCSVIGTTPSYLEVRSWPLAAGRMFTESEINAAANVAVLGSEVRKELFGSADPVGEDIRIGNLPFRVVGLLTEKGSSGFGSRDNSVLVPYTTQMRKIDGSDSLSYMSLQAHTRDEVKPLEAIVVDFLNERYRVTDPENGGFGAFNMAEVSEMAGESTRIFSMLLGGIASVSLLVGGIGVMNIMLVSVTERIREIGIRMAIGARGRDILGQFLMEAIVLSLSGGALGVLLGLGVSHLIGKVAGWPSVVSEQSILLAFGTSAAIGIFFGFYPALSASRLDPIQALRND